MKVIIAGSRTIANYDLVCRAIAKSQFEITEVVSGHARGVDKLGELWANRNEIPLEIFKAEWEKYGRGAGVIRNTLMAKYVGESGGLIAITTGSSGTEHMIGEAIKFKLSLHYCFVRRSSYEHL